MSLHALTTVTNDKDNHNVVLRIQDYNYSIHASKWHKQLTITAWLWRESKCGELAEYITWAIHSQKTQLNPIFT